MQAAINYLPYVEQDLQCLSNRECKKKKISKMTFYNEKINIVLKYLIHKAIRLVMIFTILTKWFLL